MQAMREELEDLAFRWVNPEAYETVINKLNAIHEKNEGLVEEIRIALEAKLTDVGIDATVHGREKKPYSIWSKMQNKQIGLEQLSDIYGFRIIVSNIADCYRVLGVAHTTWRTVPGRFKDYISTPKQNGYQSIHTTVVGPRHQRVELQIRTKEMHDVAEYGVAAHSFYKDSSNGRVPGDSTVLNPDSGPYHWLRRLVDTLLEGSNPVEFLEHTKLELFQDQVFCFSPKGRLIALPFGATPLDFAYAVHTDIGNAAVGAYINGRHMPIDTKLRNGDEVEILTSKTHTPPAAWEHFAVTGRARSAIRRAARDKMRRQYTELGRRLITSAMQAHGETYADDKLKAALGRLSAGPKTVEDILAGVARNEISVDDVLRAMLPDVDLPPQPKTPRPKRRANAQNQEGWFNLTKVTGLKFRVGQEAVEGLSTAGPIPLRGLRSDIPVTFEEGGAVPGDRIVGVLTPGEGIRIFQIHSPRLRAYEHERWIDVTWDINREQPERFPARIAVTDLNEPGTLAQIAHLIGEANGNIDQIRMISRGPDFTEMLIEVEVWDLDHLNSILSGLKAQSVVSHADRVFD
jgi:GTP pyrophosphokinase